MPLLISRATRPVALATAVGVLLACSAARAGQGRQPAGQQGDFIRAEVQGELSKATAPPLGGEHTGWRITAAGVTWEVDVARDEKLREAAERLAGRVTRVMGTYAERTGGPGVRRVLSAESIEMPADGGQQYVEVTVHGTVRTGVVAIGAETTGATITAGGVTWDLELRGVQRAVAGKLNGRVAVVSGQLRRAAGVELRDRFIVDVRSIEPADGDPSPPPRGPGLPNRDTI